jgi:LmbE family N-acetylglucosaminyl deacetylase
VPFSASRGRFLLLLIAAIALLMASSWLGGHRASKEQALAAPATRQLASPGKGERILIFAPHPDDEVLGCGGLIQQALANGAEVHVALMTNGDGSELSLIFGERELSRKPRAFVELGRGRQQESISALGSLGLPANHIHFLGYPNNGLVALWRADHWLRSSPYRSPYTGATASPYGRSFTPGARYCGEQVLSDVTALLEQVRPTAVYVTHPQDIHPDHWVSCAFVSYGLAALAARSSSAWAKQTQLYGYLIHWPHFPSPRRLKPQLPLSPPHDIITPRSGWLQLPLSPDETKRKLAAIRMYRSQLPSLDRLLLDFVRANELFAPLPVRQTKSTDSIVWVDEDSNRRGLHGADITELLLELRRGSAVTVELTRSPHRLGKGAYLSLDLRSWDASGRTVIMSATIDRSANPKGIRVADDQAGVLPITLRTLGPGRVMIGGLSVPGSAGERFAWILTCWGSARDRVTDPAVVARLVSGAPVSN